MFSDRFLSGPIRRGNTDYHAGQRFDLVSSFYGPGATTCWYLTILSCFVSWLAHPHHSDKLTSDFVAALTFPGVAAGHLAQQIYFYPGVRAEISSTKTFWLLQHVASIEASLNVSESFLPLCAILLCISIYFGHKKRTVLLGILGLLCLSAEFYYFVSCPALRKTRGNFSRYYLVDFGGVLISLIVLVLMLLFVSLAMVAIWFLEQPPNTENGRTRTHNIESHRPCPRNEKLHYGKMLTISFILLSLALCIALFGIGLEIERLYRSTLKPTATTVTATKFATNLIQSIFPRCNISTSDLDQAVAIFAGGTILAFSICSAMKARYKQWKESSRARKEVQQREQVRLRRLRTE
ncbi:hypothetical protein BGZ57DRAFT_890008 [Hyaloscypha finlandica]|nr:hypothetical protein BGZ57DRAFT_890008 [Hyaloscypha finlandica]